MFIMNLLFLILYSFNWSRDHDGTVNGKYRNEVKVDNLPHSGKAAKDGLTSLECEKMIDNVKSSG